MAGSRYGFDRTDTRRGFALGAWIVVVHVVLVMFASGSCDGAVQLGSPTAFLAAAPDACGGSALLGGLFSLELAPRDGAWLGLGAGTFVGFTGQLYGLGLLTFAALVSVLLLRWGWASPTDTRIVGALWAGSIIDAVPRILNGGVSTTALELGGVGVGLDDLALAVALLVLVSRVAGELRA